MNAMTDHPDTLDDTPILDLEAWDLPDVLSTLDCLAETGSDRRWSRSDDDMENDR